MDLTSDLQAACTPEELFAWVSDLGTYPRWLGLVERVEPDGSVEEPAWIVDLAAQVGPFSRSKRLRMVATERDEPRRVVFERRERDGRDHGLWRMTAQVSTAAGGARLAIDLHYGGRLWGPVLEPVLSAEVDRSRERLRALVEGSAAP
jgi:hypothetical protein